MINFHHKDSINKKYVSIVSGNDGHKPLHKAISGLILGLRPANERRRYFVMTSLIGWVQA